MPARHFTNVDLPAPLSHTSAVPPARGLEERRTERTYYLMPYLVQSAAYVPVQTSAALTAPSANGLVRLVLSVTGNDSSRTDLTSRLPWGSFRVWVTPGS